MNASALLPEPRCLLEQKLKEIVVALRKQCGPGNLTLHVPESGDFVAILQIDESDASDLAATLQSR